MTEQLPGHCRRMHESTPSPSLQELLRVVQAQGVTAVYDDGAIVVLQRRLRRLEDGTRHTEFRRQRLLSFADLDAALLDDGYEVEGEAESIQFTPAPIAVEPLAAAPRPAVVAPGSIHDRFRAAFGQSAPELPLSARLAAIARRVIPEATPRSVIGVIVAGMLAMSAWQDAWSDRPHAPIGTFAIAAFALWQVYRRKAPVPAGAGLGIPAMSLLAAACQLAMAMMIGHAFDGLLFKVHIEPAKAVVGFLCSLVVFTLVRSNARKLSGEFRPEDAVLGLREATVALACLAWVGGAAAFSKPAVTAAAVVPAAAAQVSSVQTPDSIPDTAVAAGTLTN